MMFVVFSGFNDSQSWRCVASEIEIVEGSLASDFVISIFIVVDVPVDLGDKFVDRVALVERFAHVCGQDNFGINR